MLVPDIVEDVVHHPLLGVAHGNFQAFSFTVTGQAGRGVADGAVRVHPYDRLLRRLGVPGIHLSGGKPRAAERGARGKAKKNISRQGDIEQYCTDSTMMMTQEGPCGEERGEEGESSGGAAAKRTDLY